MTKLVIIRHGNTFAADETPRRVGARTDIPLVESGVVQARTLGLDFKDQGIFPDMVFTSELLRTQQTAQFMLKEMGGEPEVKPLHIFNEIDYGPDENKIEADVIDRVGEDAIEKWNKNAIVPEGWKFDPEEAVQNWEDFSDYILSNHPDKIIFVVTSNGIARFAPYLTGDFEGFSQKFNIKLSTGAYGMLVPKGKYWQVLDWNIRPKKNISIT